MSFKKKIFNYLPFFIRMRINDKIRRKNSLENYNSKQYLNPVFQSSFAALDYFQCIFVHIPKNAGLSISYTLFGNTGGSHRKIKNYKKIFSPATFKKYYKFTFVRNPWDRLVSTFFFLKNGGLTEKDRIWAEENIALYTDFDSFVKSWLSEENINKSLHFQHQHEFLENEKGEILLDFIGRFETIESDFKIIANTLKIDRTLKKSNASRRKEDYRSYYNEETKNRVAEVYAKDIQLFNYQF